MGKHVLVADAEVEILGLDEAEDEGRGRGAVCVVILLRGRVLARKDAKLSCEEPNITGGEEVALVSLVLQFLSLFLE